MSGPTDTRVRAAGSSPTSRRTHRGSSPGIRTSGRSRRAAERWWAAPDRPRGWAPAGRLPRGDRERHVERHRSALEQHGQPVALLEVPRQPLEVGQANDPLAVDLADDVAALDAGIGGGAAVLNGGDDHALGRAQVELAGDVGRDRAHVETEQAPAAAPACGDLPLVRRVADLEVERLLAAVAPDPGAGRRARRRQADRPLQVTRPLELLAVELEQDVAGLEPRLGRRAVAHDVG